VWSTPRYVRCLAADYVDGDHVSNRDTAQIVRETKLGILDLSGARFALKLLVHLVHHAQTGGADGMPEALQPVGWAVPTNMRFSLPANTLSR